MQNNRLGIKALEQEKYQGQSLMGSQVLMHVGPSYEQGDPQSSTIGNHAHTSLSSLQHIT